DAVLAFLGRMFAETGIEVKDLTVDHLLADDSHAAVLLEATMTLGGRTRTSRYVDVYRLRDGRAIEHWHLPLDRKGEEGFFAGCPRARTRPDAGREHVRDCHLDGARAARRPHRPAGSRAPAAAAAAAQVQGPRRAARPPRRGRDGRVHRSRARRLH